MTTKRTAPRAPAKRISAKTVVPQADAPRTWTFLTNHAHVLISLAREKSLTARELAYRIGITERAVQAIIADLTDNNYLTKKREGRRNTYTINRKGRLRHSLESAHTIGELIDALS